MFYNFNCIYILYIVHYLGNICLIIIDARCKHEDFYDIFSTGGEWSQNFLPIFC